MKNAKFILLAVLFFFVVSGCGVIQNTPTPWPPQVPDGQGGIISLPVIQLAANNIVVTGTKGKFLLTTANSLVGGASEWPPFYPEPVPAKSLDVRIRQGAMISHDQPTDPVVWLVTEYNLQGVVTTAMVLPRGQNAYNFLIEGERFIGIRAYWTRDQYVTYFFSVKVKP